MKWKTAGDIWDYLRPLRQKDDAAMSQKRADLEIRYFQWSEQRRKQIVFDKEIGDKFEAWLSNEKSKK